MQTGPVPPRRVRSPRKAREWIDRAAVEIATSPADWPEIVNSIRLDIGRPPLSEAHATSSSFQFVECTVGGLKAAYPVRKLQPVAGGGMNAVLKSAELFAGRELAFRRHLPAESAVEEATRLSRESLLRERLLTLPRHPVIPRYWASGMVDGEPCDVFDFAPGVSLSRLVSENGLSYGLVLDFTLHAARGLQYLHGNGLIHGDVKPENFCVEVARGPGGESRVKVHLIDFDIVSTPDEQVQQYALGNALEGTLPYMPPENFAQMVPESADEARRMVFAKDVFALGMTLVRVINGRFPKSFYTSINSLLDKKTAGEEVEVTLPASLPLTLQILVRSMCAGDWHARPSLATVIRTVRGLKEAASAEERTALVTPPSPALRPAEAPTGERAPEEHVGPYRVVNRSFGRRPGSDPSDLPLAELQDPFGRRLVGVPFAFATQADEQAFYEERVELLKDLNGVRVKHAELFPGSFRDLVREEKGGRHLVWIIRPLLEGAKDLNQFLEADRPSAPVSERLAILRRTAQALAALEDAGYSLTVLTPEVIFFVPQPDAGGTTVTRAAMTRPLRRLFDVPTRDPRRRYRQELMGTASARRGPPALPDPTVESLLDIGKGMGLDADLGEAERGYLAQIAEAHTWRERVDLLVWLEMQYTAAPAPG